MFKNDPAVSIRSVFSRLQLSSTTVHCIFHEDLFLILYKLQKFQELKEVDELKRLDSANHFSTHLYGHFEHLLKTLFSNKWMFRINGVFNKQKVRI